MATMIKFRTEGNSLTMRIVNRGWKICDVWLDAAKVAEFLFTGQPVDLRDGNDFVSLRIFGGGVIIKVTHVVPNWDGTISGRQAELRISKAQLLEALGKDRAYVLSHEEYDYPHISFSQEAQERIASLSSRYRRAFCKFIRNAFRWPCSSEIRVWPDFIKDSFIFQEARLNGDLGICGGIVLSDYNSKAEYSIHT